MTAPTASAADGPILAVRDLEIAYRPGPRRALAEPVPAVRGVSFEVARGERLAIIGESGSGKSTITQALLGILPPAAIIGATSVDVDGVRVQEGGSGIDEKAWNRLRRGRVAYVPQDPSIALNPVVRIGRQIGEALRFAEPELEKLDRPARALELLTQVGLEDAERVHASYPHQLSGGQRQRVLLAIALVGSPRLLIADEPTSGLDVEVQKRVLDLLDEIVEATGVAIVLVTHDLAVAAGRSDRILVLSGGRIIEQGPSRELVAAPQAEYTRRLLAAVPRVRRDGPGYDGASAAQDDAPAEGADLRVEGLVRTYRLRERSGAVEVRAAQDVSFAIPVGRTYGLVGQSGSGKSTIARLLAGIDRPDGGDVLLGGRSLTRGTRAQRRDVARDVQFVFQNPYGSLDPRQSIRRILAEPLEGAGLPHRGPAAEARIAAALEDVALPADTLDRRPPELSGGQRQRVAIARGIITRPQLLVLDEPVSALDVSVQAQVLDLLVDLQREHGTTYLLISHDLAVISQVAHRVGVLRRGVLVEEGTPAQLLDQPRDPYTRRLVEAIPTLDPIP